MWSFAVTKKNVINVFSFWYGSPCWLIYLSGQFSPTLFWNHDLCIPALCSHSTFFLSLLWLMSHSKYSNIHVNIKKKIIELFSQFSSVQSLSRVWLFATPWIAARQASLSITNSRSSLRLTSIESVMPSSHLILCRPLLLLPPIPPSIRVFSNESALRMRWPKYWSFSFSIIPSKEIPGLISFRMSWLALTIGQSTHLGTGYRVLNKKSFFS